MTLTVPIPSFVTDPTYCVTPCSVTNSDGSSVDPSIFTIDYVANTISIFYNDNALVEPNVFVTFPLKISAYMEKQVLATSEQL